MKTTDEVLAELRELIGNLDAYSQSSVFRNESAKIGTVRESQTLKDAVENIESAWDDRNGWKKTSAALMGQKARAWRVMESGPHAERCASVYGLFPDDERPECDCWKAEMRAALKWDGKKDG